MRRACGKKSRFRPRTSCHRWFGGFQFGLSLAGSSSSSRRWDCWWIDLAAIPRCSSPGRSWPYCWRSRPSPAPLWRIRRADVVVWHRRGDRRHGHWFRRRRRRRWRRRWPHSVRDVDWSRGFLGLGRRLLNLDSPAPRRRWWWTSACVLKDFIPRRRRYDVDHGLLLLLPHEMRVDQLLHALGRQVLLLHVGS